MARPRIAAGEIGTVQITRLAAGSYRARARARDDAGRLHQLRVVAETEETARVQLQRRAATLSSSGYAGLTASDTIADACAAWLAQARVRSVLGLVCGYAVRDDAIPFNPVRDVQRLPMPEKKTAVLTAAQITGIRELKEAWRADGGYGPRPNYRALIDGMGIMLGTSARTGECIGLRRCDVTMTTSPPTVLIDGTITQTSEHGVRRKNAPKCTRQRRRIALPAMAAAAVRRRLALAAHGVVMLLFPTSTGKPMSVSNYERLLRSFIADNRTALEVLGVDPDQYTTHIYRRTIATLVEQIAGITLASRLLGHANEQITRTSCVVTAETVDPLTADIVEAALGGHWVSCRSSRRGFSRVGTASSSGASPLRLPLASALSTQPERSSRSEGPVAVSYRIRATSRLRNRTTGSCAR